MLSCFIISRLTSGEVRRLSTYSGGFDPRTRYQHAIVVLGEGSGLSIRIRWVRVPSMAPILLSESKHGVGASLLTKNELGSIPSRTANQLEAVVGLYFIYSHRVPFSLNLIQSLSVLICSSTGTPLPASRLYGTHPAGCVKNFTPLGNNCGK